jgi:hypothetical protein
LPRARGSVVVLTFLAEGASRSVGAYVFFQPPSLKLIPFVLRHPPPVEKTRRGEFTAMYVYVSSLDIYNKDLKKCHDIRSIFKRNTVIFILVQIISKGNSLTSSLTVLCCKIRCP